MTGMRRTIQPPPFQGSFEPALLDAVVGGVHVAPVKDGWMVHRAGQVRRKRFRTQAGALSFAHKIGKGLAIFLHDGQQVVRTVSGEDPILKAR